MKETLREKAMKKIDGPNANPSQLGDPISLKAEQSEHIPTDEEKGATKTSRSSSKDAIKSSSNNGKNNGDESLREKAVKELHGSQANPTQLGDPTSLKAETTDDVPTDGEDGAHSKKDSKL